MSRRDDLEKALLEAEGELIHRLLDPDLRSGIADHTLVRMVEVLRREVGPPKQDRGDPKGTTLDFSGLPPERAEALRKALSGGASKVSGKQAKRSDTEG